MPTNKTARLSFYAVGTLVAFIFLSLAPNAAAWRSSSALLYGVGFGTIDNHTTLFDEAISDLQLYSDIYPDIYSSSLRTSLRNGADNEDSHYDPDDNNIQYWYKNEDRWKTRALDEYKSLKISDAYLHWGYAIHLVQDIKVPAHYNIILHGWAYTYHLTPPEFGDFDKTFTAPKSGDNFERYASWHHDSTLTGGNPGGTYWNSSTNCNAKYWYPSSEKAADATEMTAGQQIVGAYGQNPNATIDNNHVCSAPTTATGEDWFNAVVYDDTLQRIVGTQLHAARTETVTQLLNWSKALPPLVSEPLKISAGKGVRS